MRIKLPAAALLAVRFAVSDKSTDRIAGSLWKSRELIIGNIYDWCYMETT